MIIEVALLVTFAHPRSVPVYHVQRGDSISAVAVRHCGGQARDWTGIYAASRARHMTARNANYIVPGQKLALWCRYVPSQLVFAASPTARPAYVRPGVYRHRARYYSGGGYGGSNTIEKCIIARESGGNYHAYNPTSGAGGRYQFLPSTWHALGHRGLPQNASPAEQDQAFRQEVAQSGYSAWRKYDGC